jgi:hypothetical protein
MKALTSASRSASTEKKSLSFEVKYFRVSDFSHALEEKKYILTLVIIISF